MEAHQDSVEVQEQAKEVLRFLDQEAGWLESLWYSSILIGPRKSNFLARTALCEPWAPEMEARRSGERRLQSLIVFGCNNVIFK